MRLSGHRRWLQPLVRRSPSTTQSFAAWNTLPSAVAPDGKEVAKLMSERFPSHQQVLVSTGSVENNLLRRSRFSRLVAEAYERGLISSSNASDYLGCSDDPF